MAWSFSAIDTAQWDSSRTSDRRVSSRESKRLLGGESWRNLRLGFDFQNGPDHEGGLSALTLG